MRFWTWLVARLAVAILLLGWILSALFLPGSGKKELQRSLDALKKVNSFHYNMVAAVSSQKTDEEADLVCSDDSFHRKIHIERTNTPTPLIADIETLRSGGRDYRLISNGLWRRDSSGLEPARMSCERIAQGQATWIVPDIAKFVEYGVIDKGDKKAVNGKLCREWKIADLSGPGPLVRTQATSHVSLCLDIDDHLPREMLVAENNARWVYEFDKLIHIDVPTALEPEPRHDAYQPPPSPGLTLADPDEN
jgi:hypothetical protein